jgi:hypothetical protein
MIDLRSDTVTKLSAEMAMIVTVIIQRSTSLRKSRRIGRESIGRSAGRTMPILQMRHFQKTGNLSDELVAKIQSAVREDAMSAT